MPSNPTLPEEPPMTTSDPTPVVEMKPFHAPYPGMPELFHTYCSACPDYGVCDEMEAADVSVREHMQSHALSDPTPEPPPTRQEQSND